MLGDLAVAHTHHVHGLELDFAAGWRDAEELAPVRAMVGLVGRHPVAIGKLPVDDGIAWRSSRTGRIRERIMRNAAGTEIPVKLAETIGLDDPEATCRAALLGLGVTLIAVCHALPHLGRGTLVRLVPQWYSDGGPISVYFASRMLLPSKTRAFVDFVVEAFKRDGLAERFAGSLG
jgi:DNA-binding transcriptional LysR family regulator